MSGFLFGYFYYCVKALHYISTDNMHDLFLHKFSLKKKQ